MAQDKHLKTPNVPPLRFPGFTDEWKKTTLGNNCEIQMCKRILAQQTNPDDGVPFFKIGTIGGKPDAYISSELFNQFKKKYNYPQKGEVLISCAGTVGRCVRFDGKPAYFQDSNIVWPRNNQNTYTNDFLYYILSKQNWRHLNTTTIIRIYNDDLRSLKFSHPSIEEQQKITSLLSAIDKRIATQNKIIEDLKKLKSAIIDGHFNGLKANCRIGELITEISQRNRRQESLPVLSVSNRSGFIAQSEQFGNRTIASEDTSNYKIVITNDFAFNPARINVGSIARLINYEKGIVSPMYICFRCKDGISSEYLDLFFKSRYFQTEVGKRLEGSVRQCLSIDGIKSIQIERIPMSQQMKWAKRLTTIESKLTIEENIYQLYKLQRKYLLSKMLYKHFG